MGWESLHFESRQAAWTGWLREFRQHHGRGDKPTQWLIAVKGNRVRTEHGILGGAMQKTDYVGQAKNIGKTNAITAEQDALAEARRDCRKKRDFEGFDEYVNSTNIDHRNQDISIQALLTDLPGSFCLYKPENNLYDQKKLLEKAKKGEVWYSLKRDGVAKWVVVDYYGNIQIYSRRSRRWNDKEGPTELPDGSLDHKSVVPWASRFPHLVEAVKQLELPPGSMMACELVTPVGQDNFPYISGLTKGYTARALEDMLKSVKPALYWWDLPFYGGEDLVTTKPVRERYGLIRQYAVTGSQWIQPVAYYQFPSPETAEKYALAQKIEGFVVVDPEAIYGDKGWNLKGKPDRPSTCAKLKPRQEDDFIAKWDPDNGIGTWGSGKHEKGKTVQLPDGRKVVHGGVGSVGLYQLDSKGSQVYICDCASGMDFTFQSGLKKSYFPAVWQCEYTERTYISDGDKTNALRFPTFLRERTDKQASECTNSRL